MQTAPFWRKIDKLAYIVGSVVLILFSFIIGRYPFTYVFTFYNALILICYSTRIVHFFINRWHMYLIDFCYFSNMTIVYYLIFAPKDKNLFIACFLFGNGALAASVAAFRNSLVYHKIDYLTSLAIHALPMVLMTHIRWYVMYYEADKPESEQTFCQFDLQVDGVKHWFMQYFVGPLKVYFSWLAVYGFIKFVIFNGPVMDGTWDSTWGYFSRMKWVQNIIKNHGVFVAPLIFLFGHFVFYIVTHCIAVIAIHSMWINLALCVFWLIISFYNGANFYMESFSRKYEVQLAKLIQFEKDVKESKKD